ncbi:MAG: hypothetical protein LBG80_01425 [Bacteroidales bacterium]|jgi:hypothetical protein|nr:hypothetical protein [Bacteroidales bacterium]
MSFVSTDIGQIIGQQIEFVQTSRQKGYSNFFFVNDFLSKNDISPHQPSLSRVLSLARKHEFQGMLIDEISIDNCSTLQEETEALAKSKQNYKTSKIYKFSFFKKDKTPQILQDSFIGYAVFKIDYFQNEPSIGYVFESVLPPPRTSIQNSFLHCKRTYNVTNSLGNNFEVTGTLYAQQSVHSFVCAHVALRTVLSCILPEGDITYSRIANLAGSRKGLNDGAIEHVLTGLNLHYQKDTIVPDNPDCSISPDSDFMKTMYGYIESGNPALLGFEGHDEGIKHIVPIIGHTFNEYSWVPHSNRGYFGDTLFYYPSERWLSSHIMHDDNFGPYYCLPKHFITQKNFRLLLGISPTRFALSFDKVEASALGFLSSVPNYSIENEDEDNYWFDLFHVYTEMNSIVLRSVFISKDAYINHLRTSLDTIQNNIEPDIITKCNQLLPQMFWMIEVSCPELFSITKRKFGELLLATEFCNNDFDLKSFCLLRLPGLFILSKEEDNQYNIQKTQVKEHTRIFSNFN